MTPVFFGTPSQVNARLLISCQRSLADLQMTLLDAWATLASEASHASKLGRCRGHLGWGT